MADKTLNNLEKVAVLLKGLPSSTLDDVLRRFPKHAGRLRTELGKLAHRADYEELRMQVMSELQRELRKPAPLEPESKPNTSVPAPAPAVNVRPTIVRPQVSASGVNIHITGSVDTSPALTVDPTTDALQAIAGVPPDLLAMALERENSRTISLLINSLDIEVAAQIYKRLPPARLKEVSARFTQQGAVPEEVLRRIAQAVLQNCTALSKAKVTAPTDQSTRDKRIASLMRGLEREARSEMLKVVEETDADMATRVKSMLYTFEDILRMENSSVQKLLSEVDTKSLALSLSGAPPELQAKLLSNLSKRAQESLKEEMEMIGTPTPAKVKPARQSIVEAIQRLDERGELNLME